MLALMSALIGVLVWHFNGCLAERKARATDFKNASRKLLEALEKQEEAYLAVDSTDESFMNYLSRDKVDVREIRSFLNQSAGGWKNIYERCISLREAFSEYDEAFRRVRTYYCAKHKTPPYRGTCGDMPKHISELESFTTSELVRFAQNKSARLQLAEDFEYGSRAEDRRIRLAFDALSKQGIINLEAQSDSLIRGLADCLCFTFRGQQ